MMHVVNKDIAHFLQKLGLKVWSVMRIFLHDYIPDDVRELSE